MTIAQKVQLKSTEFQPKNEYLLIKTEELPDEEITDSGVIIPLMNRSITERSTCGTVIALGTDIADLEEGDFVLWPNTDGLDMEFTDGKFLLLRYESIIGSKKK